MNRTTPGSYTCYPVLEKELDEFADLSYIGLQAFISLITAMWLAATAMVMVNGPDPFWSGTMWGTGAGLLFLVPVWLGRTVRFRRMRGQIRERAVFFHVYPTAKGMAVRLDEKRAQRSSPASL